MATRILFTDPVLVANATDIKGIHVAQLRQGIDAVRISAGLLPIWTAADYQGTTGFIQSWQFYEASPTSPPRDLFNAVNQARDLIAVPRIAFPGGLPLPAANQVIYGQHLLTLRGGVR